MNQVICNCSNANKIYFVYEIWTIRNKSILLLLLWFKNVEGILNHYYSNYNFNSHILYVPEMQICRITETYHYIADAGFFCFGHLWINSVVLFFNYLQLSLSVAIF